MAAAEYEEQPPWVTGQTPTLTLEDLSIDDSLTPLQRVQRYVTSPIPLQRLVHVKLLASTAATAGLESTRLVLLPLLSSIAGDEKFVVRQHLGDQILRIAQVRDSYGIPLLVLPYLLSVSCLVRTTISPGLRAFLVVLQFNSASSARMAKKATPFFWGVYYHVLLDSSTTTVRKSGRPVARPLCKQHAWFAHRMSAGMCSLLCCNSPTTMRTRNCA